MISASKGKVEQVTVPKLTGNFWADMGNPHNSGTLWMEDGVWKQLKTIEQEEDEEDEKSGNDDDIYERRKKRDQERYSEELPGFREALLEMAEFQINMQKHLNALNDRYQKEKNKYVEKLRSFEKKLPGNRGYQLNTKLDYAIKNNYSMMNQFGYILPELKMDDDGEFTIKK
jgi:hypothetical protein